MSNGEDLLKALDKDSMESLKNAIMVTLFQEILRLRDASPDATVQLTVAQLEANAGMTVGLRTSGTPVAPSFSLKLLRPPEKPSCH